MLVSQTPGGLYERFFEEIGMPMDGNAGGRMAFEDRAEARRIVEVASGHGIEIPSPFAD
jgi:hypothetical protein